MKRICLLVILFLLLPSQDLVSAHSGRTDSSGGHNCSSKSQSKGLCTGYHSHNSGGSTSQSPSQSTKSSWDKDCSDFASYNEVVEYWNSKGYSKTNDPEKLDGWGNAVDDGIPCEAPSGYDTAKINGSPAQIAHITAQKETAIGEKEGYAAGLRDGYQENENSSATNGSEAYQSGYTSKYSDGFKEGSTKIEEEKKKANQTGFSLGQKQDQIKIPSDYTNINSLTAAFTEGFNRGVINRDKKKEAELHSRGYSDGKKDIKNDPKNVKESYLQAYRSGFNEGQQDLKQSYIDKGYLDAFTMLEYKQIDSENEKYITWYEEGFKSNTEVAEIEKFAYTMGLDGEKLAIPEEYLDSKEIFEHYFEIGSQEHEEIIRKRTTQTATGLGLSIFAWFGRRFYVAKKMVS